MTIAEIRGKLSGSKRSITDKMEDLLTSDIFTASRYVRPKTLLLPFFANSTGLEEHSLQFVNNSEVKLVHYYFWPRLSRSIPDVLISLELESGDYYIFLIEAKYLSSKSSNSLSSEELVIAKTPRDQLAREYMDLLESHDYLHIPKSKISGFYLIYITANRCYPADDMNESDAEIRNFIPEEDEINLYWASWYDILPIIRNIKECLEWEKPILEDLEELLKRKKFSQFEGIELLNILPLSNDSIYLTKERKIIIDYHFDIITEQPIEDFQIYSTYKSIHDYDFMLKTTVIDFSIYKGG